jgi:hypothetical protein
MDILFPAATGNREAIEYARTHILPAIASGRIASYGHHEDSGPYRLEFLTAENFPALFQQMQNMNRQLNERYGTQLASPDIVIVDNHHQIAAHHRNSDLIIISRRTMEEGNAAPLIAHELAERQGVLVRGDLALSDEVALRQQMRLPNQPGTIERHRANECYEDADAMTMVGPEAYQRALHAQLSLLGRRYNAHQLNDISAGIDRGGGADHYPTTLERHRLAETFRNNPGLLEQFRNNPHSIQFDGACNVTQVEDRGSVPAGVGRQSPQERHR